MCLLAMFHPRMSLQAAQWLPITTPIPQFMDALTHMPRSTECLGIRECGVHGTPRIASHHWRFLVTGFVIWWQVYSLGNLERNDKRGGRNVQPSWYMKVMCWRVPWKDSLSLHKTLAVVLDRKVVTLARYLTCFLQDRETECPSSDQTKPMYVTEE